MCGIAGFVKNVGSEMPPAAERSLILSLAQSMLTRGNQSFGLYVDGEVHKEPVSIIESYKLHSVQVKESFYLHTRHATHGDLTTQNCHPFIKGSIIGAHNGVIGNHEELNIKNGTTFTVDSEHIFSYIDQQLNMQELKGYGAIVYGCYDTPGLFIGRFNGGELSCAKTKYGIVFASTEEAVEVACWMAGIEIIHYYSIENKDILYISPDGNVYDHEKNGLDVSEGKKWDWRGFGVPSKGSVSLTSKVDSEWAAWAESEGITDQFDDYHDEREVVVCDSCGIGVDPSEMVGVTRLLEIGFDKRDDVCEDCYQYYSSEMTKEVM